MKRYIKSTTMDESQRSNYVDKVRRLVMLDLGEYVKNIIWDMNDNVVSVYVTFLDDSRHEFTFETWRFSNNIWYADSDADMIIRAVQNYMKQHHISGGPEELYLDWAELDHKMVYDSDGFRTDYTLYVNADSTQYICIFGDRDYYTPENSEPDFECDTEREAREWFDDYEGFETEDLDVQQGFESDTYTYGY